MGSDCSLLRGGWYFDFPLAELESRASTCGGNVADELVLVNPMSVEADHIMKNHYENRG